MYVGCLVFLYCGFANKSKFSGSNQNTLHTSQQSQVTMKLDKTSACIVSRTGLKCESFTL